MKRIIALILALGLVCAPIAIAKDMDKSIVPTGVNAKALVTFLYNVQTYLNKMVYGGLLQPNGVLLSYPFLAAGTNTATLKTTNAITYVISGIPYMTAATDNFCDMTTMTNLVGSNANKYLVSVNASGTCVVTEGTKASTLAEATWPSIPSGHIVIGGWTFVGSTGHNFSSEAVTDDSGTQVKTSAIPSVNYTLGTGASSSDPAVSL